MKELENFRKVIALAWDWLHAGYPLLQVLYTIDKRITTIEEVLHIPKELVNPLPRCKGCKDFPCISYDEGTAGWLKATDTRPLCYGDFSKQIPNSSNNTCLGCAYFGHLERTLMNDEFDLCLKNPLKVIPNDRVNIACSKFKAKEN
jgi:hypothetical protein